MLSSEAEVPLEEIRTGAFLAEDYAIKRVEAAHQRLKPILERVHIDDEAAVATSHIISVARQKKLEWGDLGLIVVDYLHILQLSEKNKVDALGDATKDLRALAKELGCPVLLLSQLSRQPEGSNEQGKTRKHRRPELSDLRSSGEIEQSADVVMFLYRESYYDEMAQQQDEDVVEVIIRKHRNGRTGIGLLKWIPKYVKYQDMQ
jgi:replicative DNA helicase